MIITDENSIINYYQQLEEALVSYGMGWITEQTRDTIRTGESIELRINRRDTLQSREHTNKERLLILLDNIENVISDITDIEENLMIFFTGEKERYQIDREVFFYSPDFVDESINKALGKNLESRRDNINRLKELMEQIRDKIR